MHIRHWHLALTIAVTAGCTGTPANAPSDAASPTPRPTAEVSAAPSTAPSGFLVRGRVYDGDVAPVAATVTAQGPNQVPISVTAGQDGLYELRIPGSGTYEVSATKVGWTGRTQSVTVNGDMNVDFGGQSAEASNPYFLSNTPEVSHVDLKEAYPGGPLTLTLALSEAITSESQKNFGRRVEVTTSNGALLMSGSGAPETYLEAKTRWDDSGRICTMSFDEPRLASGTEIVPLVVRLGQEQLPEIDPVTLKRKWDSMEIQDLEGMPLGYDRADFAFLAQNLFPISLQQLANKDYGDTHSERRWVLTHQSTRAFAAAKDEARPGLVSARVLSSRRVGAEHRDIMEIRFTEPMRVVKSLTDRQFTQLDKDKNLFVINVSKQADGSAAAPLELRWTHVRFSQTEPDLVLVDFPSGVFMDQKWVEVTLGPDAKDPAGNAGDPQKIRVVGQVFQ